VYYLFRTVGTVSHPSNNALTATNGTFSGTLGVTGTQTNNGNFVVSKATPNVDIKDTGTAQASMDFLSNSDTVRATIGMERSAGGGLFVGSSAYAAVFGTASSGNTEFATNNNIQMKIDSTGAVTMPNQPAFLVTKSGNQTNITAGGAAQTITFETEVFDQNDDFSSNTFTAPVTGRYQLQFILSVSQIDLDATQINFRLATSNRNIQFFLDPKVFDTDSGFFPLSISALADMDANDTCIIQLVYDGGSQTDVAQESHFSGYLVC